MTALTAPRDTRQMGKGPIASLLGGNLDTTQNLYPGSLVCFNPLTQKYTPAVANPALVTVGVYQAQSDVVLSAANGGTQTFVADVMQGVFKLAAGSGADAIPATTPPGTPLYVIDNQTVGLTDGGGTRQFAGCLVQVDSSSQPGYDGVPGVWVEIRATVGFNRYASVTRKVRGVVSSNVASLAVFSVTSEDGLTYAQGDRVLLVAQSTTSQNGIYLVGAVNASQQAPLTRPPDWFPGQIVPAGAIIEAAEGTVWGLSTWKLAASATDTDVTVDSSSAIFYPRVVKGIVALSGTGSVTVSNLAIAANASASATDTTAAAAVQVTLTSGAGSGSLTLHGTASDQIAYVITNF